jgi:hypothetical protein
MLLHSMSTMKAITQGYWQSCFLLHPILEPWTTSNIDPGTTRLECRICSEDATCVDLWCFFTAFPSLRGGDGCWHCHLKRRSGWNGDTHHPYCWVSQVNSVCYCENSCAHFLLLHLCLVLSCGHCLIVISSL